MSLAQRIETLRKRHAQLEEQLKVEEHRPLPDLVRVHKFKREKLELKDRIAAMMQDGDSDAARQSSA